MDTWIKKGNYDHFDRTLPAEAMNFDGEYLEGIVPGYNTISVSGRETMKMNISSSGELSGHDGEIFESANVMGREIIVTYSLVSKTAEEFRYAYDLLKHTIMRREPVDVFFADDLKYTYKAIVSEVSEVEAGVNTVVGEIVLFCPDPYKYNAEASFKGLNEAMVRLHLSQPVRPVIELVMHAGGTKITVTNTRSGNKIILDGSYSTGQTILIDATEGIVTRNGQSIIKHLNVMESDFFHFTVQDRDTISVTPSANVTIRTREKVL